MKEIGKDFLCIYRQLYMQAGDALPALLTAGVQLYLPDMELLTALFTIVERCHAQNMPENFQHTVYSCSAAQG